MSKEKELKFFCCSDIDKDINGKGSIVALDNRVRSFEEYKSHFIGAKTYKMVGESSPHYLYYYSTCIKKIQNLLGDIPIIIILRNPIYRAFSAYSHLRRDSREHESFRNALRLESKNIENRYDCIWHFKHTGLYYEQIRAYKESFSRVDVYIYEDWAGNFKSLANTIFESFNLRKIDFIEETKLNVSGIPRVNWLNTFYNSKLVRLLQRFENKLFPNLGLIKNLRVSNLEKKELETSTIVELENYFREDVGKLSEYLGINLTYKWFGR